MNLLLWFWNFMSSLELDFFFTFRSLTHLVCITYRDITLVGFFGGVGFFSGYPVDLLLSKLSRFIG